MKQIEAFDVNSHFEDVNGNVSASGVIRYMQECANLQLFKTHPSYSELRASGKAYILSKINVSIYATLHAHDQITVHTWLGDCHGVVFNRYYKIFRGEQLVAEGASLWGLIGTGEDRKIYRVTDVEHEHHKDTDTVGIDTPRRFTHPPVEYTLVGEKSVLYSDCDVNGHMNNTNYPDMLFSFIPAGKSRTGQKVVSVKMNFVSEAPLGQTVKIYTVEYDGVQYFRTVREDGRVNVEAEMIIE